LAIKNSVNDVAAPAFDEIKAMMSAPPSEEMNPRAQQRSECPCCARTMSELLRNALGYEMSREQEQQLV
jgi:hypothetical protein